MIRYHLGIAAWVALCACSIDDPEQMPEGPGSETDASEPASPDAETLPPSARLVSEPVHSVEELPGRYAQPFALPGQVSVIRLDAPNLGAGDYELYRSCGLPTCVHELGRYHVVPTNPAIGFAALSLIDATGTLRNTYILDLLWRDGDGRLVAVQLRALVGNATGPTQVWWRLPDEDRPEPPGERALGEPHEREAAPVAFAAPASGDGMPQLGGVFVRPLPVYGDVGAITLGPAAWAEETAIGAYQASYPYCLPWCIPETGTYELELASVAIGSGRLSLAIDPDEDPVHEYVVYAIWRTLDGTATAIQLQRVDGVVPVGPPFTMYRQWWTGSAAAAPETPASCTVWRGLELYYRTRALQCGMSACWPLSPWYASWAQYYQGLADAAGCTTTAPW